MSMSPMGDRHAAKIFGIDTPEDEDRKTNADVYAARRTLLDKATRLSDRPYTAFDGRRVAGVSGNEQAGITAASRNAASGVGRAYLDKAGSQIDSVAANEFSGENVKKYMDPYVEGVVNTALRKQKQAYGAKSSQLKSQAASRGAFGSDRQTMLESNLDKSNLEAVGDLTSAGYSDAFRNAQQMWGADNERKTRAADAYRAVGNDVTRMDSAQIEDLMKTGGVSRVLEQMQLDTDYSVFLEKRDWDVTNLQPLMQALGVGAGARNPMGSAARGGSEAGQMLGAVSAIVGYFGSRSGGGSEYNSGDGYSSGGAPGGTYWGAGGGAVPDSSGVKNA